MTPDRRFTHRVRGLELVWHGFGDRDGPAVVCVHGFLDHGRSFSAVAAALGADLCLWSPDLRGHGESGWVGAGGYYHFYDYFDDVRRGLDAAGLDRFLLVGHSMGGSIATGIAALMGSRVRGLVLLEGMGPPYTRLEDTKNRLARWMVSAAQPAVDGDVAHRRAHRPKMATLDEAAAKLCRFNPRLDEARAFSLAASFAEPVEGGYAWRYDPLHRTPAPKPFLEGEARALWATIEAPTLSLYGEHGMKPPLVAERHLHLRGAKSGVVPKAGHNLHHERPELVAAAIRSMHETGRAVLPDGVHPG